MDRWIVYKTLPEKGYGFAKNERTGEEAFFHFRTYAKKFQFENGYSHLGLDDTRTLPIEQDVLFCQTKQTEKGLEATKWVYEIDKEYSELWEKKKKFMEARNISREELIHA